MKTRLLQYSRSVCFYEEDLAAQVQDKTVVTIGCC